MNNRPHVAIVIVNWNKRDYLYDLLKSLGNMADVNCDIIVVDNASTDDSVQILKKSFPDVFLLVNEENIGGAGGFNTGIRHALKLRRYKYIWLLDNDAEVKSNTLTELVEVMENDNGIGIAGSMIINPDNKDLIVELGLNIDWNTGIVKPFMENFSLSDVEECVYKVDYVPACSALIRTEALSKTNLMDERYFIWWDDTDLGLSIQKIGYKIVGVTKSIVYHPTEKDWILINYYNNRNALLAFSKFAELKDRIKIFHRIASYSSKGVLFHYLTNNRFMSKLLYYSLADFFLNRWKQYGHEYVSDLKALDYSQKQKLTVEDGTKIIILPTGNLAKITKCVDLIRNSGAKCSIALLIQEYRKSLFEDLNLDDFILYNDKKRHIVIEHIRVFSRLLFRNFDIAIMPSKETDSPFGYIAKKYYVYDVENNAINFKGKRIDLWKVIIATIFGELIALPLTFFLLIKSHKYNNEEKFSE